MLFYNHTAANQYIKAGFDSKKVFVALNCLDQSPIQKARKHWLGRPDELAAFRREQRLETGPVALFVSRLGPERRIELLLEAMTRLAPALPDLQLVVIGKGEHQTALKTAAEMLGIAQRVRFVGAIYDEMALAPWFLSADCLVFPAYIGLSLQHAFGYALPVITSNRLAGHGPEIEALRDGENGMLYADGDMNALAGAMRRLLENPSLRQSMAAEALKTVTERFTLSNMVDGFEAAARYCMRCSL
jgi:glycosyltransferase involved in cell wall biosynthesis